MNLFRSQSVRTRLTLWFSLALAILLTLYSWVIYGFLRTSLFSKLDDQLHDDFEMAEEKLKLNSSGNVVWAGDYEHGDDKQGNVVSQWIDVWTASANRVYSNKPGNFPKVPLAASCGKEHYYYETVHFDKLGHFRVLCGSHTLGPQPLIIRVARSLHPVEQGLAQLILIIGICLPLAIILSALGGYWLARRALLPVEKMANQARTITADRLGERLPVENPKDELGHLAMTFNETFARLEDSFEQMRRFTADASHELRTPLTSIRSVGEVYLGKNIAHKESKEAVASMLEEADRMRQLIDSLLTLSRTEAGRIKPNLKEEDLVILGQDVIRHLGVLAEEKEQKLTVEGEKTLASVDYLILRQAIINLVDNAIKYCPPRTSIRVRVAKENGAAIIEVIDRGPGIADEHHKKIFERFYRVDKSRARNLGGVGLGLSIAEWATKLHGGSVELESKSGHGSTFRIVLPFSKEGRPA